MTTDSSDERPLTRPWLIEGRRTVKFNAALKKIQRIVSVGPRLTNDQRERLAEILLPTSDEGGQLFHHNAILPLGDGKRVWMEQANSRDLVAWDASEAEKAAEITAESDTRKQYVNERLEAMRQHPDWTLGRVERELFGYDEDEPFDDYDDEDE